MSSDRSGIDQWPGKQGGFGQARLWRIGVAMTVSFIGAVLGLAALAGFAWLLVGVGGFRRHGALSLHDTVSVVQLVFASVAGAGALVALVVSYRRQKVAEADSAYDRVRVFNERFTAIASQLGDDRPAVRLAGVHAMAGLADDWQANRQTCIDVLCAYLRMPYESGPGEEASSAEQLAFRASREVRQTVIRVINAHLQKDAATPWHNQNFDFTGVLFDGGDFTGAVFIGAVSFLDAAFTGGTVNFDGADFSSSKVSFDGAEFSGGKINLCDVKFTKGRVSFDRVKFSGAEVNFERAWFSGGVLSFVDALFSGGRISFSGAGFSHGTKLHQARISFDRAHFSGGKIDFVLAISDGVLSFASALFSGGEVSFDGVVFARGATAPRCSVNFTGAEFSGGKVSFDHVKFDGGRVNFDRARFSGGVLSFVDAVVFNGGISFTDAMFSGAETDFCGVWFRGKVADQNTSRRETFAEGVLRLAGVRGAGSVTSIGGGWVSFTGAEFSGGKVSFDRAKFDGGSVAFNKARFSGGTIDFERVGEWSRPPRFDGDHSASGVLFPSGSTETGALCDKPVA